MKLLYCKRCGDIFNLSYAEKSCSCGNTYGYYKKDGLNAEFGEFREDSVVPLGIANSSFNVAVNNQPESGSGIEFKAFVIPKECKTLKKK